MVELYKDNAKDKEFSFYEEFLVKTEFPTPAVVIFPGGAYEMLAHEAEGSDIAKFYNEKGINAFVVHYRLLPENQFPCALQDAQKAIKLIRKNAKQYNIDPDKIIVEGFSAGGHLAGCTGLIGDYTTEKESADISPKPNGMILCYPLITNKYSLKAYPIRVHKRLTEGLSFASPEDLCLETRVDETAPPCFIWQTFTDEILPTDQVLSFASALKKHNVPFEMHIYPDGWHGLGLGYNFDLDWSEKTIDWIKRI